MLPGTRDDDVVLAGSPHAHVRARWIPARPYPCPLDPRTHTLTGYARTHAPGPRTHAPGPCTLARTGSPRPLARSAQHTRTGSPRPLARGAHLARSHRVPTPAWSPCTHTPGPHARSLAGSLRKHAPAHACTLASGHARTLAPGPHARSVSMHARTGPMRACSLRVPTPARTRGPHACVHRAYARALDRAYARALAPGLCTRARTGPMHSRSHRAYARALAPGPHACSLVGSPCTCAGSLHSCMLHPMLYVVVVICSSTTVCILV